MPGEWRLQEAKNNLNLPIKKAASGEAQVVSVHGKPAAGSAGHLSTRV